MSKRILPQGLVILFPNLIWFALKSFPRRKRGPKEVKEIGVPRCVVRREICCRNGNVARGNET